MTNKAAKFIVQRTQSNKLTEVLLFGAIEEFEDYADLLSLLQNAGSDDGIIMNISCCGGRCDIGFAIIDAIKKCKAVVDMVITYPTYSMGALIALSGDTLQLKENSFIMFHDYSGGQSGKGDTMIENCTNYSKVFRERFLKVCTPFLTKAECRRVFDGKDLYINDDDPTLDKRLVRHEARGRG